MTAQDWTIVIGVLTTSVVTGFTAWTTWADRRDKRRYEQEKEQAEAAHRRKMEELQMVAIRQGGVAAKEAKKAREVAVQAKQEVITKIEGSAEERRGQFESVVGKIEDNTKYNQAAIETANGVNDKIRSLGEEIAGRNNQEEK